MGSDEGQASRGHRNDLRASLLATIAATATILLLLGAFEWFVGAGSPRSSGMVEPGRFAMVRDGMTPSEVRGLIGRPATTTTNPAEGLQSEPLATCWHYTSADRIHAYSVCFVDRLVVTRGAYLMEGSGLP